jgi:hypothetical protein
LPLDLIQERELLGMRLIFETLRLRAERVAAPVLITKRQESNHEQDHQEAAGFRIPSTSAQQRHPQAMA